MASNPPPIDPKSSLTDENFAAELRSLAAQARADASWATWARSAVKQAGFYGRAVLLLVLAAVSANASLAALSPVYGAIPAAANHTAVVAAGCFVGWSSNLHLRRLLPHVARRHRNTLLLRWNAPVLAVGLPLLAAYLPVAQYLLAGVSTVLTARWGPAITEALTLFPLVAGSAACVATELEAATGIEDVLPRLPSWLTDALPGLGSWVVFKAAERWTADPVFFTTHLASETAAALDTRVLRQLAIIVAYAVAAPSRLLWYAVPALLHAAVLNVHVAEPTAWTLPSANVALQTAAVRLRGADTWVLLDRRESVTGYLAVLENLDQGFRVLRCDHSLLGGEWTRFPANPVAEPIYGVFVMLEAVRLVDVSAPVPDADARALVIGLGIGTAPAALVAHGIDTTVVEIDPGVHDLASRYFHMPANHTAVVEDAVTYADRAAHAVPAGPRYDYIVHDVFTGGAEPISLFTLEFLQDLHALLKPTGVIAINYAGDFSLTPIKAVVHTIRAVFPSCRVFREHPSEASEDDSTDFANVVIFCTRSAAPISFRRPTTADLLNSATRRQFLVPTHEVTDADFRSPVEPRLVRRNDTEQLSKWHYESALGHWQVMRRVLPAHVWELW
ncbi:spermine spermidine synthase family protein [Grosmannia clavigera kw1407]|uniref:Spermine spermidine synthase family protein n=1 Tax=Grosmannia clavigera (strain kw1407 / UAMH 11150) TaxID=655863 RepID=F0XLD8_GROCL|nr:spermine spermidine synthase family protein [Grosmannia clavigera kw1407]EFX01413.1 spermine spermidine synthase family protein [Grosmannia clavigera kw1407]